MCEKHFHSKTSLEWRDHDALTNCVVSPEYLNTALKTSAGSWQQRSWWHGTGWSLNQDSWVILSMSYQSPKPAHLLPILLTLLPSLLLGKPSVLLCGINAMALPLSYFCLVLYFAVTPLHLYKARPSLLTLPLKTFAGSPESNACTAPSSPTSSSPSSPVFLL